MRCVIVGAGRLGSAVHCALRGRDADILVVSRSSGVDVTKPKVDPSFLEGADAVVEATDIFTRNSDVAREFFTSSTRSIGVAARQAGVRKHVLVSIVNCGNPRLAANGYYAAKAAQERVATQENDNLVLIRSTLWFEFARQNLNRMKVGPLSIVPQMTAKPVALASVAEVVADCVVSDRSGATFNLCGPERITLWEMTKKLPHKGCIPVPLPMPGDAGRALRDGTLVPGRDCEVMGPAFNTWLRSPSAINTPHSHHARGE